MFTLPKKPYNQGQVLLSILIAIAVFSILAHALFTLIASSFELVTFNKARITARHIAQEKIETIRNLPYDEVATIGGIPNGTVIPQTESIERNGLIYTIKTDVIFIDDSFDGIQGGIPDDTSPEDYKRVRVEVSWEGLAASRRNPVILMTDVSAMASGTLDGGTIVILVLDANGSPVPQAQVNIRADTFSPPVNLTQTTGSDGRITLPGALECIECYQITVNKSEMSTDRTYSTSEATNPLKPHASVFLDQVTQISFAIDRVGSINISSLNSREENFLPLGNVSFRLRGNKIIGTNAFAQPVYKYEQTLNTNEEGVINLSNMEWDVYNIETPSPTTKDISGTVPLLPLNLIPGGNLDFKFTSSAHTDHSFFITVKDNTQNLIASASARLYDDAGFEENKFSGDVENPDYGQVLFSNLSEQIYHLDVSLPGFQNFSNDYSISGYTKADIILSPE